MSVSHLAELRAALARVRRRWLAGRLLGGATRLCGGVSIVLLLVVVVELLLAPPDIPMLLLFAAALAAAVGLGVRILWPLGELPSDRQVARFIEERCPELEDRVVSAAQLAESTPSSVFRGLVFADAVRRLGELDLARVVTRTELRRAAIRGGVSIAILASVLTFGLDPIGRLARTAWLYAFPNNVTLEVDPGDIRLMAGQPLRVEARLAGGVGAVARTSPILSVLDGSTQRVIQMRPTGDGFLAEFSSVDDSFYYEISAASLRTRRYRVEALTPPRVLQVDVEYAYPAFTGLPPRVEEDGGDVFAPAGTEVRLRVHVDKPITDGALVLGSGQRVVLDTTIEDMPAATFMVETDQSYRVAVTDNYGLTNRESAEYFIRATLDRIPEVQVLRPGGDREVTPLEEVTIQARADDDYRVEALELVYRVGGKPERSLSFDMSVPAPVVTGTRTLFVENLAVEPGDFISYYARVRDVGLSGQSTEATSDIFFLEIRSFDGEFEEAQSQSGMGQTAEELANLAKLQKQIIVATWRLDRESDETAVADDIRAVAEAQGELGETAARAAERIRGRGRERVAGNSGPAPEHLAMEAAVKAMADAAAALLELHTGAAIRSEMEALDQILTVEAAVRRRQVSTSRGQGARSSGNQAQQDLSALFDRELLREQETSYETASSAPAQDEDESEALRRLRELAERQEQVNRELSERDETRSADQRRRVLERLTREQQLLREDLEELAAQLSRHPQGQEGSGQPQLGSTGLRQIAEQMRRTLSSLRRADTDAAREGGVQALDEMRRLDQRLRGDTAGERAGALADLQLEAQQLAEAQRRVAREVGEVAEDNRSRRARIRLANEKDDLADRVNTLDQSMADLTGADDGTGSYGHRTDEPLRVAREALGRESVSRRMRMGSDRLRRSATGSPQPSGSLASVQWGDEETALADVLVAVAELLQRASGNNESQQLLLAQLDAAQLLRQQLRRLETELESRPGESGRQAADGEVSPEAERLTSTAAGQVRGRDNGEAGPQLSESGRAESDRMGPGGAADGQAGQARREFVDGLEEHSALLERLRRANLDLDRDLEQWAQDRRTGSSPGTELFKLDMGNWVSLRRNLENALQQFEADRLQELAAEQLRDGVSAGSDGAFPSRYQRLVDRYFRSVATAPASP